MKRALPAVAALVVTVLLLLLLAQSYGWLGPRSSKVTITPDLPAEGTHPSFLYGRVRTPAGSTYEGRLRWGRDQEAFWGEYFNGVRKQNPWAALVPPERLPKRGEPFEIFGIEIARRARPVTPGKLFLMRFGDIARVDASVTDVRVTLKSKTTFVLARSEASDFDDGLRIWDRQLGVVDLDSLRIQSIEFFDSPAPQAATPARLFATVQTELGDFTGYVQWEGDQCLGSEELVVGDTKLRFDSVQSIQRRAGEVVAIALSDGQERTISRRLLTGRGIYVDDLRYGRVLISPDAFRRVEFNHKAPAGPRYGDFRTGSPLAGTVTTRDGRQLTGRLVYDLDESESTETLDASLQGVTFNIPFDRIASIALPVPAQRRSQRATVLLRSGETVALPCSGDLGEENAGLLVFANGTPQQPVYVPWSDVARLVFAPGSR